MVKKSELSERDVRGLNRTIKKFNVENRKLTEKVSYLHNECNKLTLFVDCLLDLETESPTIKPLPSVPNRII
jgi:hypothetical protein